MKLLCVIDSLGSGGAQRQLVTIARGFKARGHAVDFFTYYPHAHFKSQLDDIGIPVLLHQKKSRFAVGPVIALRRLIRDGKYDAVLAFLETPSVYAELATVGGRTWQLVVGERCANPAIMQGWKRWLRAGHVLADWVVTNSHTNREMLLQSWPRLNSRLVTIYNAVDLDRFHPVARVRPEGQQLRLVVGASYAPKKNMLGVAEALVRLREDGFERIVIDWFGGILNNRQPFDDARAYAEANGIADLIQFNPPTTNIEREYQQCDAVGLFSHFEGLPNVVCEAMACGRPVIMSDVCDARHLIKDGRNGILCDPKDSRSIASAIRRFAELTDMQRESMGVEARRRAETLFAPDAVLDAYEQLLKNGRP